MNTKHRLYLSQRNLEVLLSKLDQLRTGFETKCTIIKNDHEHEQYAQTMQYEVFVKAIEGDSDLDRVLPGQISLELSRTTLKMLLISLLKRSPGLSLEIEGKVLVTAVRNEDYYVDRPAGAMANTNAYELTKPTLH